jgi:hypothetical protein
MTANTSQSTTAPTAHGGVSWATLTKVGIAAGILIVVFLLGYIPSAISAHGIQQQNAELQHKLGVAELGNQLAMASYEANRNNYANALQFSSQFFNGLPKVIADTKDEVLKERLQAILALRSDVTSNPSQVDETVKDKLATMYAQYFQTIQPDKKPGE